MDPSGATFDMAVVVGLGEMGSVFARGLLRAGHVVVPVTRQIDLTAAAAAYPSPEMVLITVGEADLAEVLAALPDIWKDRVGLLQNELLPRDWVAAGIADPTVAVVWFEKKPGQDVKTIIPSPIGGPHALRLAAALDALGIPTTITSDGAELTAELVTKNLYILTMNIGGLLTGGSVVDLWEDNHTMAAEVADEVLDIQSWLTGRELDRSFHIAGMQQAIAGDPQHKATGRSAPTRLARALGHAAEAGIDTPRLAAIAFEISAGA